MTVEHIRRRIAIIRGLDGDFEAQHAEEDQLMRDVLRAIATNDIGSTAEGASDLAEAVLKSYELNFLRACA